MARGQSKKAQPYTLESDLELPEEERTTFWLRPYKGLDAGKIMSRYARAERLGRGNRKEIDARAWRKADIESWLQIVEKVDNFHFSEDYPDLHKQGWIAEISDQDALVRVAEDLSFDYFNEIVDAASKLNQVSVAARKK